jgi:hypothetical protein
MKITFSAFAHDVHKLPHEQSRYWARVFIDLLVANESIESFKAHIKKDWDITLQPINVDKFVDITGIEIGEAALSLMLLKIPPASVLEFMTQYGDWKYGVSNLSDLTY